MQTHAPRKAGGRPERRLLRQSSHDMDVPVLRKPGRGCERHSRLCIRACVLSAAVFCVAYPIAAVVVQRLVDDAELTVQTFILTDPEESSIYVDVVGGALSMVTLPLQTSLDDLRFTLLVGNSTVGQMSAGSIPLGYGGSAPIDLDGRLHITDHSGFRQLSEAVIRHETVGLSIDGIATVRAGWLGLPFRNVRVAKHVEMRGANGLAVRIRRFELLDSPARLVGAADVTPLPLHLEMEVDASNPSDFEFLPLGELQFRILTTSGSTFALTTTEGPVSLSRGNLSYFLRGQLWVETRDDLDRFEILLAEYAAGRPSPIVSVFHRVRNQPVYEAALQGLGLHTELPGVPGGVRMFDQVVFHINTLWNIAEAASSNPFKDYVFDEAATLRLSNPFNITTVVAGFVMNVVYQGGQIGTLNVPRLEPPIALRKCERLTPDRMFDLRLQASVPTLRSLLLDLVGSGHVVVSLEANLTLRLGDLPSVRVSYVETNVPSALGMPSAVG